MTDETLDGVFINPGFFGMCNKCFTAVMRVMRRDTEGLNSLIKVASIEQMNSKYGRIQRR